MQQVWSYYPEFLNRDYYIKGDTIFKVKRDTIYINKSDFDPSKVSVEELDKKIAQLSEPFDEKVLNFNYGYTRLITEMSDMDNLVYERGNITKDGYVEPQDTVKVSRQEVTDYNNSLNLREIRDKKVENEFKDQNIKFVDGMFRSVKPDNY